MSEYTPLKNLALNERWLHWATFWANHRDRLRRYLIGFIVLIEAAAIIFSAYGLLDYFVFSRSRDAAIERAFTMSEDTTARRAAMAPTPLPPPIVVALPGSGRDGQYDVLLKFSNPNPQWISWVTYTIGEVSGTVLVLPDSERFAIAPAAATSPGGSLNVQITDVRWRRIRNLIAFQERVPQFVVSDVTYTPGTSSGVASGAVPNRVQFIATNESAYGFWTVGFTVVLLQGDQAVAAQVLQIEQILPGAKRAVALNFYAPISGVSKALVVEDVDIVNDGNLMAQPGDLMRF